MPRRLALAAFATLMATALVPALAHAERFAAVDAANRLYAFDDRSPGTWTRAALRGLPAGERIVGLDVRPATRQLIGLTNRSRLVEISRAKRSVTPIGPAPFAPALLGASFGFDFNPMVDRIRVVSASRQNLRLDPASATVVGTDGTLRYKDGDVAVGVTPVIVGAAYTNNVAGATSTALYGIEIARSTLVLQETPNEGVLSTVGPLGVNLKSPTGFDISARDGAAYLLSRTDLDRVLTLYRVDLSSGRLTSLGKVRGAPSLIALATLSRPRAG